MDASVRFLFSALLLGVATMSLAQRSASQYGTGRATLGPQGAFGGGFGGSVQEGVGGGFDDSRQVQRPEDAPEPGIWTTKTAILTPGDRYEIKLHAAAGDTLMAAAVSDSFDPALEVDDKTGQALAKNDDREDGDQSPFVICHFDKEGDYSLKVLSYRSVSGGKFTVKLRQFAAVDASVGTPKLVELNPLQHKQGRIVFRFPAEEGKVYDLWKLGLTAGGPHGNITVVGPTGVDTNDLQRVQTVDGSTVFKALAKGDYYCEFRDQGATKVQCGVEVVPVRQVKTDDSVTLDLTNSQLAILDFPVEDGTIVRTTLDATPMWMLASGTAGRAFIPDSFDTRAIGSTANYTWFRTRADSDLDVVRVFHGKGTARIVLRSPAVPKDTFHIANSTRIPTWDSGKPIADALKIGESKIYVLNAGESELTRVAAKATQFELLLDIFEPSGASANRMMNPTTHAVGDDLYFPRKGAYIVRIACDGHGGSGTFEMKRDTLAAMPYAVGRDTNLKLDGVGFGLYSMDLKGGRRYELVCQNQPALEADLLDEAGMFVIPASINFDKVLVRYFVPPHDGRYRLWLRGPQGSYRFRFAPNTPPEL